jgi:hypothetical protein
MPSSRFLERSARVLEARVVSRRHRGRRWRLRLQAAAGGLVLATAAFLALKGLAIAAGASLPAAEGPTRWLAGPDPVAAALGQVLQPIFAVRG